MSKVRKKRRYLRKTHRVWQIQEAKARFSELINAVEKDGYHTITKNDRPVAVILSKCEFEKMRTAQGGLLDFFRESPLSEFDLDLVRNKDTGRDIRL